MGCSISSWFSYEIKEDIDIYASLGSAMPLSIKSSSRMDSRRPTVIGYSFGLIYSF